MSSPVVGAAGAKPSVRYISGQLGLFVPVVVSDELVLLVAVEELEVEALTEELDVEALVDEVDLEVVVEEEDVEALVEELDVEVVVVVLCVVLVEVVDDTSATWKVPVQLSKVLGVQTVTVPPFVGSDQHAPPVSKQLPMKL